MSKMAPKDNGPPKVNNRVIFSDNAFWIGRSPLLNFSDDKQGAQKEANLRMVHLNDELSQKSTCATSSDLLLLENLCLKASRDRTARIAGDSWYPLKSART